MTPPPGKRRLTVPTSRPSPPAKVSARFRPDGAAVDLVSQCPLEKDPPPCLDDGAPAKWRLYSWPLRGGPLKLERADLPPGAAMDPRKERFAWIRGKSICVGDYRRADAPCVALPD